MYARFRCAAVAFALFLGTAACVGDNPAGTTAPSDPNYDGGVTFGSGGRASTSGTENTTAADSGSTARGGVTFGSGG